MVRKGNLAVFESSNISESGETTPTKIGAHAFDINPYLHEFFEPVLFFDHMDYIVHGSEGKFELLVYMYLLASMLKCIKIVQLLRVQRWFMGFTCMVKLI